MSESLFRTALSTDRADKTSVDAVIADMMVHGQQIKQAREYYDGEQPTHLTPEKRRLLDLPSDATLNSNHCPIVVDSMTDRLEVTSVESIDETATPTPEATPQGTTKQAISGGQKWIDELLRFNRFDGQQSDIFEAAIKDGDAYVMTYFDNVTGRAKFSIEPAFDGISGMYAFYDTPTNNIPSLAMKAWHVTSDGGTVADTMRLNKYYPGRLERYISKGDEQLRPFSTQNQPAVSEWVMPDGSDIGVPIIHFRNRRASYSSYGVSELRDAIPIQNSYNRTLYSLLAAGDLTAFRILVAMGFVAPASVSPGMIIEIAKEGMTKEDVASLTAIDGAELTQFLETLRFLKGEIGDVTNTPRLSPMGSSDASGEALKQREIGLTGKLTRFQIKAGNAVEDMVVMLHRVETAFAVKKPPALGTVYTRWKNPEIRNDKETIENANLVRDSIDQRTYLETVAQVFEWDEAKIDQIIANKSSEDTKKITDLGASLPGFNEFGIDQPAQPKLALTA